MHLPAPSTFTTHEWRHRAKADATEGARGYVKSRLGGMGAKKDGEKGGADALAFPHSLGSPPRPSVPRGRQRHPVGGADTRQRRAGHAVTRSSRWAAMGGAAAAATPLAPSSASASPPHILKSMVVDIVSAA